VEVNIGRLEELYMVLITSRIRLIVELGNTNGKVNRPTYVAGRTHNPNALFARVPVVAIMAYQEELWAKIVTL